MNGVLSLPDVYSNHNLDGDEKNDMIEIRQCSTDSDFSCAMRITKDYVRWLNMDLSFQGIDKEFSDFPLMYGPPHGLFLVAWHDGAPAGGAGLRSIEASVSEMKRLFVYDRFRNQGIGHGLCTALIQRATALGYEKIRLDTLGHMKAAMRLYRNLGFKEIEPYCFNPDRTTKYMELSLRRHS